MQKHKENFTRTVLLTAARIVGVFFSLVIPMYLGRKLSVETYGTYKQLMLFFWFAHVALNLGFDDSAFYFHRRDPKRFSLYSFNALIFNLSIMGILWITMTVFKEPIALFAGNQDLAQYLPLLGYLILATVSSMQIEGILYVGLNKFNQRLGAEIGTELLKSLAIIAAFFFFDSIYMCLVFLSALMTLRLVWVVALIHSGKTAEQLSYKEAAKYFVMQAKYGLPLGVSRIFQNILNIENYFISHFFSLAQFTYYSVGCFENPLVNAARTSIFELTSIELVDALKHEDRPKAIEVWRSMTRKLFLIIVPFVLYMIFFAKEIMIFIFSEKYLASVPFFMVFNLYLFVGALNPELIYKATSETYLALKIKIAGLTFGLALFFAGALLGGPLFALAGKILGVLIMNLTGLVVGARLLGTGFFQLFKWKELGGILIVSLGLSAVLRYLFLNLAWHPFWILAASFSLFVLILFILSSLIGLIKEDELIYLRSIFY